MFSIWPLALGMLLGLGLAAPAWLALFDYLRGSAREVQDSSAHFQWLVPPAALPAFILPGWTVDWTDFNTHLQPHTATEMANGLAIPAIVFLALLTQAKALVRYLRWEFALLIAVLILSMLPTANVFRWSFRWLPLVHLVLGLIAAEAWRLLPSGRRLGLAALGLVGGTGVLMWLVGATGPHSWLFFETALGMGFIWSVVGTGAWSPAAVTFVSLLATYFCLSPHNGVPRFNLDPRLTSAAPLDPTRLYLSVYPAAEYAYRSEARPMPFGTVVRIGSTSMWGGIRLVNGYSPIRPAGVAREFDSAIHGELALWACDYFPAYKGGPNELLAQIGVDGIIVASELEVTPKPDEEWRLVYSSDEGRVYHRRGDAYPPIRSSDSANIKVLENSRQRVVAEVSAPSTIGAQLRFSRPYFRGYRAYLNGASIPVKTYQNLIPVIELPPGVSGRLIMTYQPWWLTYGGVVAGLSALFSVCSLVAARRA